MEETKQNGPTAGEVLQQLQSIGLSRAGECLQMKDGHLELRPEVLEGDAGAAIAYMECTDKGWKVKFYDKLKALELLGEHFGLFREHAAQSREDNNLLQAIVEATKEDVCVSDLSELQ